MGTMTATTTIPVLLILSLVILSENVEPNTDLKRSNDYADNECGKEVWTSGECDHGEDEGQEFRPTCEHTDCSDMAALRTTALVTTQWLKRQLGEAQKNLRVLDATWSFSKSGHESYLSKHISSAQFFDLNKCIKPTQYIPRNIPEAVCFEEYLRSLGINHDSHVVVYDGGSILPSARTWWMLRTYGHPKVSVLDGGLEKWIEEGGETGNDAENPPQTGDFNITMQPHLMKTVEQFTEAIKTKSTQIIDARAPHHFEGKNDEPAKPTISAFKSQGMSIPDTMSKGHIPGSINCVEDLLIDGDTHTMHKPQHIEKIFKGLGVDLDKPITSLCYNANAACVVALGAAVLNKNISVYYGSWTEYGQRVGQSSCVIGSSNRGHG